MTQTASRALAILAVTLTFLGAGCSISSEVTAVTFRSENESVLSEEWNGAAECRVRPGAEAPCAARSSRQRLEAVVE
jgi:hypothetical protein